MKEHNLIWSNNKAIFNLISDNTVWKHKVNILIVNFGSDYIIYCPFQMQKQFFLHSLAIWHENIKPLDLIVKKLPNFQTWIESKSDQKWLVQIVSFVNSEFNEYLIVVLINSEF
jgi:hypothetical protein